LDPGGLKDFSVRQSYVPGYVGGEFDEDGAATVGIEEVVPAGATTHTDNEN
jgi:hypothetical protein